MRLSVAPFFIAGLAVTVITANTSPLVAQWILLSVNTHPYPPPYVLVKGASSQAVISIGPNATSAVIVMSLSNSSSQSRGMLYLRAGSIGPHSPSKACAQLIIDNTLVDPIPRDVVLVLSISNASTSSRIVLGGKLNGNYSTQCIMFARSLNSAEVVITVTAVAETPPPQTIEIHVLLRIVFTASSNSCSSLYYPLEIVLED